MVDGLCRQLVSNGKLALLCTTVSEKAHVMYNQCGCFDDATDDDGEPLVADVGIVVVGELPFTGKLSYAWPRSTDQVPLSAVGPDEPLFPFGYGLE
jgi:hypothetical protein